MSYPEITAKERFFTTSMNPDSFAQWWMTLKETSNTKAILISGKESRTTSDFFNEVANKLEFASYFGHNWDAFADSLSDFAWEPNTDFVMMFNEANELLSAAKKDDLLILIELLNTAFRGEEFSEYQYIGDHFKIIFQVTSVDSKILKALDENSISYLSV